MIPPDAIAAAAQAVEASPVGAAMRGTRGLYPAVNLVHLLGVVLLLGPIGALDLRVLGLGKAVPLGSLSRFLTPAAAIGLALVTVSGVLLFCADAGPFTRSPLFQLKIAVILAALANAAVFRRLFGDFEDGSEPPAAARLMGAGSLALWIGATAAGRYLAYA